MTNKNSTENSGKQRGRPFPKGVTGNKGGRPKLPEEIKRMKESCLSAVIKLMYDTIYDDEYIASLKPSERLSLIEVVGDRCGLFKTVRSEGETTVSNDLAQTIREAIADARKANILVPLIAPSTEPDPEYHS